MQEEELQIHGSMFLFLKKFIEATHDQQAWLKINKSAGTLHSTYEMHSNYPVSEMSSIITAAANYTGFSKDDLYEKFGEYLVPDLLTIFKTHLNPAWKTFELLENTELVMHKAVRKQEHKANPPILNVSRVHDKLLIIDYYSKRKMANLAVGIIKGIARFYNESEAVNVILNANSEDERVQIRVEFK